VGVLPPQEEDDQHYIQEEVIKVIHAGEGGEENKRKCREGGV
jgi:hypothetical protein